MSIKKFVIVDQKRCVACGACSKVCPRNAIAVWHGCYAVVDADSCLGCGKCSRTCPAGCIELKDVVEE